MTEKEKMLNSEIYYANCEELLKERETAKDLCHEYNNLKPSKETERKLILKIGQILKNNVIINNRNKRKIKGGNKFGSKIESK